MKRCENCFESNSDGATNCVICGETLSVPQSSGSSVFPSQLSQFDESYDDDDDFESSGSIAIAEAEDAAEAEDSAEAEDTSDEEDMLDDEFSSDDDFSAHGADVDVEDHPSSYDSGIDEGDLDPVVMIEDTNWDRDETDEIDPDQLEEESELAAAASGASAPHASTPTLTGHVLQVYHDSKARVVHTHAIVNDITQIGREDPRRDIFPDLDLGKLEDKGVSANHVSRQHLRLLRDGGRYYLFVYRGTTGTQVCKEMIEPSQYGKRFEIQLGDRIVLGGKVRIKLTALDPND